MNCDQVRIPIACRFVASDQWLTTYFDSTCKISEVKQYILAKVYNRSVPDNEDEPSRNRPVSPITFASARNSLDGSFEGSLQDDHVIDLDPLLLSEPTRQLRTMRQPLSHRVASPASGVLGPPTERLPVILPPHHYPMLAFSTGQLLEDDCSIAWYRLHPHELLELHPPGTIVRFPRDVMLEYIKPYFELDVRALRVIVNDKDVHAFGPGYAAPDSPSPSKNKKPKDLAPDGSSVAGSGSPASQSARKRRKTKLEWRDRYLVIRQGMLSLFESRTDLTPVHTCSLAKLTTLRGQEEIAHTTTAAMRSPHIVCAKFRAEVSTPVYSESQPVTSPMAEHWNDPWSGSSIPRETNGFLWGKRESKEDIKQQRRSTAEGNQLSKVNAIAKEDLFEGRTPDSKGESLQYDINIGDGTQGTWLVLDTLGELAHSNLLRVLHRCSPDTINTTLVPKYLLPDSSFSSPSSLSSPLPSHTGALGRSSCRYPEWRIEVSQRAQQSGLGSVSDAMAWVLCGGPPLEPPVPKVTSQELRRKFSDLTTDDSSTAHEPFNFDMDDDGGDNGDCELEWDSWPEDLMRQALVASSSNDIAVTVTEPVSIRPSFPDKRIRPTASSSTFSSVTLPEQGGRLPSDILPGANMGLLSVDSPALLTAPSVLPFQSTGITTSTVSAGGVVRTRSLITVDGRRGRGVARAMEVLSEDGDDGPFMTKCRTGRQKRKREDIGRGAMASSAPAHSSMAMPAPTANTITTSTVTVREPPGTPSPPPLRFQGSPGSFYVDRPPRTLTSSASASALTTSASTSTSPVLTPTAGGSSNVSETASVRPGITTMSSMTTTTTIQLLPRRSSAVGEMILSEASPPSPSQKRSDKTEKEKGKGKQPKSPSYRGKVFRPADRLVSKR